MSDNELSNLLKKDIDQLCNRICYLTLSFINRAVKVLFNIYLSLCNQLLHKTKVVKEYPDLALTSTLHYAISLICPTVIKKHTAALIEQRGSDAFFANALLLIELHLFYTQGVRGCSELSIIQPFASLKEVEHPIKYLP